MAQVPEFIEKHRDVYEPSDDTFLFLDALQDELEYLRSIVSPEVIVEIGYVSLTNII